MADHLQCTASKRIAARSDLAMPTRTKCRSLSATLSAALPWRANSAHPTRVQPTNLVFERTRIRGAQSIYTVGKYSPTSSGLLYRRFKSATNFGLDENSSKVFFGGEGTAPG